MEREKVEHSGGRRVFWEDFLARWQIRGGALSVFCGEQGVSYHAAKYWKKRLGMVKQRKLRKAPSSAPHAGFAEVLLNNSDTLTDSHLLIIDLPRGARISVGAGVDTEALRIVLEVLVK